MRIPENAEPLEEKIHTMLNDIILMYTIYELYDHFMLHHYNAMYDKAIGFFDHMKKISASAPLDRVLNEELCARYAKTLCALMECCRRRKEYDRVYEIKDFIDNALQINDSKRLFGEEKITVCTIKNQYAKAKLFEAIDLLKEKSPAKKKQGKEQYKEAIDLLEANKTFNMSANLLGCIYSTPIGVLRHELGLVPDEVKAAELYDASLNTMTADEQLYQLKGTELIYTTRQLVNFMLKGYILYDRGWKVNEEHRFQDKKTQTLKTAKEYLDKVDGQSLGFINWDRGIMKTVYVEYSKLSKENDNKRKSDAFDLFESENTNMMTMIARISGLVEKGKNSLIKKIVTDKKITVLTEDGTKYKTALFDKIKENIDNIGKADAPDQTDCYYYLRDAVTFCETLISKQRGIAIDILEEIKDFIVSNEKYQMF